MQRLEMLGKVELLYGAAFIDNVLFNNKNNTTT